jgi:predicted transcriptional regulator
MRLYESELSDGEIAKRLGVTAEAIRGYRRKNNIPTKRPRNRFDKDKFIELYELGLTDGEIAKELNLTTSYICACRQKLGLPAKHLTKRRKNNAEGI